MPARNADQPPIQTTIALIRKDFDYINQKRYHAHKDLAQPRLIRRVGRRDLPCPQQSQGIGQKVTLSALDALAPIEATLPPLRAVLTD